MFTYNQLKAEQKAQREETQLASPASDSSCLKIHRAISWIKAAEQAPDQDSQFIHYWIAFNAAYAGEYNEGSETEQFKQFLTQIIANDSQKRIYNTLWQQYPHAIRILLENKYVFGSYWRYQRGEISQQQWQESFDRSKATALSALANSNSQLVLSIVFKRLYTLRNQILHGGATFQSSINREQLKDAVNILSTLVPLIVHIMLKNHTLDWGVAYYPVINE